MSGLSEYDIVPFCDCDGWNEDVLAEKDAGVIEVAILRRENEYQWYYRYSGGYRDGEIESTRGVETKIANLIGVGCQGQPPPTWQ